MTMRYFLLLALIALLATAEPAHAQERPGDLGIGGQIGDPTGITLRLYGRSRYVFDFLAAWDLDDFFFLNVHGLYERSLENSPLNYYYGPGVVFGIERHGRENELVVGISGNFGINYFVERFEVFLQLTPRFTLTPRTTGDLGGGIGLRYYL